MCPKSQPEDMAEYYTTPRGILNDVKIPLAPRKVKIHGVKGNFMKLVLNI